MLKDEPSLVIRNASNDKQIDLASASIPTGENEFKQFFKVSTLWVEKQNQTHVCIGCYMLSNRSIGNIKFKSPAKHLLTWLKKDRVFLEADRLGIDRPVTIGHFTKISPEFTHLTNFHDHLVNQLMLIEIDADTAVDLAPHLKQDRLEAMTNGDVFVPILPNFEIYRTRISHGRKPAQVATEVLGVKTAPKDTKLLGEFFTRLAAENSTDHRDGTFLPKGAAYLLGPQTYEQVLKENNFFLTQVATIPVNLAYGAWYAVIDPTNTSETDLVSLNDHLLRKPWFLRIESVGRDKSLLVTTRNNLPEAREWIDATLESLIKKSLPPGHDPPPSLLPRRLDKPVYSKASQSYAEVLKKQFSLSSTPATATTDNNRPPRKRQATIIDYDSDYSAAAASTPNVPLMNPTTCHSTPATTLSATSPNVQISDLLSLKTEIAQLKSTLLNAVEQIVKVVESLRVTHQEPPNVTDTEVGKSTYTVDNSTEHTNMETETENPPATTPDLSELIAGLKHDIATKMDITDLIVDLKSDIALIKSHPLFCNLKPIDKHTPPT